MLTGAKLEITETVALSTVGAESVISTGAKLDITAAVISSTTGVPDVIS